MLFGFIWADDRLSFPVGWLIVIVPVTWNDIFLTGTSIGSFWMASFVEISRESSLQCSTPETWISSYEGGSIRGLYSGSLSVAAISYGGGSLLKTVKTGLSYTALGCVDDICLDLWLCSLFLNWCRFLHRRKIASDITTNMTNNAPTMVPPIVWIEVTYWNSNILV